MGKVRVFFDRDGNTLSIWFDDPRKEHLCEESDDDVVLVKDRRGRVIGFERLNFLTASSLKKGAAFRSKRKCFEYRGAGDVHP